MGQSGEGLPGGSGFRGIGSVEAYDDAFQPAGSGEFADDAMEGFRAEFPDVAGQDQGCGAVPGQT